jgi:hypothetical protein
MFQQSCNLRLATGAGMSLRRTARVLIFSLPGGRQLSRPPGGSTMRSNIALRFALASAVVAGGIWTTAGYGQATYTPSAVVDSDGALNGKYVAVVGLLQNRGKNYFTDRRLVVTDTTGSAKASLPVKAWVPAEAPPGPSGLTASPPLLSDYVGKKVILEGTIKENSLRGFGMVKYLDVESARVVDEQH